MQSMGLRLLMRNVHLEHCIALKLGWWEEGEFWEIYNFLIQGLGFHINEILQPSHGKNNTELGNFITVHCSL